LALLLCFPHGALRVLLRELCGCLRLLQLLLKVLLDLLKLLSSLPLR
jgi:hypothetical protein